MKYLVVDDENEIYNAMYSDLFKQNKYDVEEIPKFLIKNKIINFVKRIIFNEKINKHIWIPFKFLFENFYTISKYKFDPEENYVIILLNGTLKNHYSAKYIKKIKKKNHNVKWALVFYDSSHNKYAKRSFKMARAFDYILSFDKSDCDKYGFLYFYSTFSNQNQLFHDEKFFSNIFWVGSDNGRFSKLKNIFKKIYLNYSNCKFLLCSNTKKNISQYGVLKTNYIPYSEVLKYSFNSNCLIEYVINGQYGISLRTCEAIMFNKKLLTNNKNIVNMPFYNSKFIKIYNDEKDIDINFINEKIDVNYNYKNEFSPIEILKLIEGEYKNVKL